MAEVTRGKDMTVIVLDNDETEALGELLDSASRDHEGYWTGRLDELTNAMLSNIREEIFDEEIEPVTNWDRPEPPWKDEPSSDYRVHE